MSKHQTLGDMREHVRQGLGAPSFSMRLNRRAFLRRDDTMFISEGISCATACGMMREHTDHALRLTIVTPGTVAQISDKATRTIQGDSPVGFRPAKVPMR